MNVVDPKWENCGFSMQKMAHVLVAHLTTLAVKWYNLFASDIFILLVKLKQGIPFGKRSERRGSGAPNVLSKGMDRPLVVRERFNDHRV